MKFVTKQTTCKTWDINCNTPATNPTNLANRPNPSIYLQSKPKCSNNTNEQLVIHLVIFVICQVYIFRKYISTVILPSNIHNASLYFVIAIFSAIHHCNSDATIYQISSLPWQEYFYLTWSSMAKFSYYTSVSVSLLKLLLREIRAIPLKL